MKYLYTTGCSFTVGSGLEDIETVSRLKISKVSYSSILADKLGCDHLITDAMAASTNYGIVRRLSNRMPELLTLIEEGHEVIALVGWSNPTRIEIPSRTGPDKAVYMEYDRYTIAPNWYESEISYGNMSKAETKDKTHAKDELFKHLFRNEELNMLFREHIQMATAMLMGRMSFHFTSAFTLPQDLPPHFLPIETFGETMKRVDKRNYGHPSAAAHAAYADEMYGAILNVV